MVNTPEESGRNKSDDNTTVEGSDDDMKELILAEAQEMIDESQSILLEKIDKIKRSVKALQNNLESGSY